MAPGNNDRQPGHTGTIPKTKVRNNSNVPQEAVTPTRRDMTSNLGSTSLDWVPVSEYNSRNANYNQGRKQTNNSSDHDLTDLDNSISFESGFGRFVPVRPQPRALPLPHVQNHDNIPIDHHHDDGAGTSMNSHSLHPYAHQMQNGLIPHTNHAPAAVMIVNPTTTPSSCTGNISQPFNVSNHNRNNWTRNFNFGRLNFDGNSHLSNNNTPPASNSRSGTKAVNLINNMYDQVQGSYNNINENDQIHRESVRALGEAIVVACPDAAAVERRLGQIREYIRVTSSLVDTMRNSEDESQDVVVRPMSAQSNGSGYSENELWQSEIKNKMELSQLRLAALKQQQKRLLKYQEEAKQQLEEMNREKQARENEASSSHDNLSQSFSSNYQNTNRMYAANQIGVATTLPQSDGAHGSQMSNNVADNGHSAHSSQDDRFSHRDTNIGSSEEAAGGGIVSDVEEDESALSDQSRILQMKLRELQLKKQHMENLVTEFQKLQMATRLGSSHNTYSSSGEDSVDEEPSRKCNKSSSNMKNEDPFKLMEIKAIKTALQKTQDLMRSVENYEADQLSNVTDDPYQMPRHSNLNENKSDGGGGGGWSHDDRLSLGRSSKPRGKFVNEQQQQQQNHEANLATLQEMAQELRMETEKIMNERARIKDMVTVKEVSRKQKKVNEEVRPGPSGVNSSSEGSSSRLGPSVSHTNGPLSNGAPGPAERRQMQLRALLADKQRELEALLNKEKVICTGSEPRKMKTDSRTASVANQSYNSEQEEPDSRSELLPDSQNLTENDNFRGGGESGLGVRSNTLHSHLGSAYGSDSDSGSRTKINCSRRRPTQDRSVEDNNVPQVVHNNTSQNIASRSELPANIHLVPPISQNNENPGVAYPHVPPTCWNGTKSNQDIRSNQFTQNSQSQTMDRLLGTPQMSYPPSMPFNMMMPYGMVGGGMCGCSCGCSWWGAYCWQQLALQHRDVMQLRDQLNHLEERWRSENVSHTLNNQVPPGNRANNYWDNFRSYSRQNLLSTNNKTNADGHLGVGQTHNPHPLVERSHNTLHHTSSTPPTNTPKRNSNMASCSTSTIATSMQSNNDELQSSRVSRRNVGYERSLSFSSAPDVLNIQKSDDSTSHTLTRNVEDPIPSVSNVNINRQETLTNSLRNLNITNPIPEIIQSHSNNLNTSNSKKKSSSKLPAKNSATRRNSSLGYSQTSNINIQSTAETPNPNLASTSRDVQDKATSKLFDLLRENVYSEVTALIGVNESHPDFLIQLFRELQLISSDPLRQKVLQSIRNVLSQYGSIAENQIDQEEIRPEPSNEPNNFNDCTSTSDQNAWASTMQIDNSVVHFLLQRCEEICSPELLEALAIQILGSSSVEPRQAQQLKKKLMELLSKYEGMRVCDVSSDIVENLAVLVSTNEADESTQLTSELSESSILQDVAGSLNLFSSSDTQLHQMNACPYDMCPAYVRMEVDNNDINDSSPRSSEEGKVDLINCSEMHNGDLAEADQTRPDANEGGEGATGGGETLPDVVDTDEPTPTEAEAEWLGLDRVPTRLHTEEASEKQKDQ